jgi:hypothetical protein
VPADATICGSCDDSRHGLLACRRLHTAPRAYVSVIVMFETATTVAALVKSSGEVICRVLDLDQFIYLPTGLGRRYSER